MTDFILPAILLVLLIISAVMAFMRRNKYTQATEKMKSELKTGDKIKTYAGLYGEIVEIKTANDGSKYAIIKSGEGELVSYYSIDLEAIYGYDFKDDIDEDTDSNEANQASSNNQAVETETKELDSTTQVNEENKEEESKKEDEPKKKTRKSKKS